METPKPVTQAVSQVQAQVQQVAQPIMNKIETRSPRNFLYPAMALVIVLAGIGTGWYLAGNRLGGGKQVSPGITQSPTEAGTEDTSVFKDTATGKLVEGGIEDEGTYHLEREGGTDQYVYLFSTVIDLQSFVGKKVQVWGQTQAAKRAPWLMDVGRVKVVE